MPDPTTDGAHVRADAQARRGGWFADRPVAVKIGAALALLAAVAITVSGVAVQRIGTLADAQQVLYSDSIVPLERLGELQRTFQGDRARYNMYALADAAARADLKVQFAERKQLLEEQARAYVDSLNDPADFDGLQQGLDDYYALAEQQLVPAADAGDTATVSALVQGPMAEAARGLSDAFGAEQARQGEDARADADEAAALATTATVVVWVSLAIGIALAAGLALLVVRQIVRTVRSVQTSVDALAAGDLTVTPDARSRDELGRMAASMAAAQRNLRTVLGSVASSADAVAASSEELSASSAQISASAEETSAQSG
ncbi:HAMP domain-containing protein, partial [Geodermatophilus sp. SYSU D00815]